MTELPLPLLPFLALLLAFLGITYGCCVFAITFWRVLRGKR